MAFERRKEQKNKHSVRFYWVALTIFFIMMLALIIGIFLFGFTQQRLALMCLDAWFCLFTMDLIASHARRTGERAFWHDWALFNQSQSQPEDYSKDETTKSM